MASPPSLLSSFSFSSVNSVLFPTSVFPSRRMCPISSCPSLIKCIQREEEKASKAFLQSIWEPPQIPGFPLLSPFSAQILPVCVKPHHTSPSHPFSPKLTRSTLVSLLFASTKAPRLWRPSKECILETPCSTFSSAWLRHYPSSRHCISLICCNMQMPFPVAQ